MTKEEVEQSLTMAGMDLSVLDDRELYLVRRAYEIGHLNGWFAGIGAGPDDYYEYE